MLAERADQQLPDSFNHLVQIQHPGIHHLTAGEGEKLAGKPGGALGPLLDLGEVAVHAMPVVLRRPAGDLLADEGGVVRDDREQVVEVVR